MIRERGTPMLVMPDGTVLHLEHMLMAVWVMDDGGKRGYQVVFGPGIAVTIPDDAHGPNAEAIRAVQEYARIRADKVIAR